MSAAKELNWTRLLLDAVRESSDLVMEHGEAITAEPAPEIIYHYTNADGLLGILQGRQFRLTDIHMMNDPSELRHAIEVATRLPIGRPEVSAVEHMLRERVLDTTLLNIEKIGQFFACCFSADGDELGQWRAYGDDGCGFAIGMDGALLSTHFINGGVTDISRSTFRVLYGDVELRALAERAYRPIVNVLRQAQQQLTAARYSALVQVAAGNLGGITMELGLHFKHMDYIAEAEYRFLEILSYSDLAEEDFAVRGRRIVRFRSFDWAKIAPTAIRKIVVGPSVHFPSAERQVSYLLQRFINIPPPEIVRSEVPYRSPR